MGTKVVVAVLVAVVVLYVVAVSVGARDRDGDAGADQKGVLGALLDRFEDQNEVPPGELDAPCLQPDGLLVVNTECGLVVAGSDERLRTVRLTALSPVTVSAPAPDPEGGESRTVTDRIAPDAAEPDKAKLTVAVGSAGAVITLRCFPSCQLRLGG